MQNLRVHHAVRGVSKPNQSLRSGGLWEGAAGSLQCLCSTTRGRRLRGVGEGLLTAKNCFHTELSRARLWPRILSPCMVLPPACVRKRVFIKCGKNGCWGWRDGSAHKVLTSRTRTKTYLSSEDAETGRFPFRQAAYSRSC